MLIRDALELPEVTALDEFITRLDDSEDRVRRNLEQFVLPEGLQGKLDAMLGDVGARLAQGRDIGRFIYGTFGSGKSHLMTVLGKMFERDETVYAIGDPALTTLRASHDFLDKQRTLVVRTSMMGKESLRTALYESFNQALPKNVLPLEFTNERQVFELIARDADRAYGGIDALIARAVADKAIPSAKFYERGRHGNLDQQLDLAARLQSWRDHGGKAVRPQDLWVGAEEGFARIARHAKEHGFTAIVWLVDELVIWIRGKSREGYVEQINDLSALVDHDAKASRVLPFFVAVAVQQDIAETCPDDLSEKGFREQLGFISDRFSPQLSLEDQDLYEVASRRVLRRRPETAPAFEAAVNAMFKTHGDAIKALSGDLKPDLVRRLYPFHPALLRVLVDVTQALSRNRTAMAALYGLLKRYPDLEVGKFLPLGALFEILFTYDNAESARKRQQSPIAQRFVEAYDTYDRLRGKIDDAVRSVPGAQPEELHQLVRTVLLCQLSDRPYFPSGQTLRERITASTLLRLNMSDVRAMTERTGINKVVNMFRTLGANDANIEMIGEPTDPLIGVKTDVVDIEKVLSVARAELVHSDRFTYCRKLIDSELKLGLGTANAAALQVTWNGTKRKGKVLLANVRTLGYAGQDNEFDAGPNDFLLLVDYPFDEQPGMSRQDDLSTVQSARARKRQWTVAWLPQHFTGTEMKALDNAAAIEKIRLAKRRFLDGDYSPRDAQAIASRLDAFQASQQEILKVAVMRLYFDDGEVHGCSELLDGISVAGIDRSKGLTVLAEAVLKARYSQHPKFKRRVQLRELEKLAEWVAQAAQTGQHVDLKKDDMEIVEAFGVPLEMVYPGESSISRRTDGQFLRAIHDWISKEPGRFKASMIREKLSAGGKDGFGFTDEVVRFFLYYLLQVEGYEAVVKGEGQTIDGLAGLPVDFDLVKADVVDPPTWDKARAVSRKVFDIEGRADLPSPPEQSKLSRDVGATARKLHESLQAFRAALSRVLGWTGVDASTSQRAATVATFEGFLDQVLNTFAHADRLRVLAALDGSTTLAAYEVLRKRLIEEQAALRTVENQQRGFKHVDKHGDDAQRAAVVTRLQNLLREPVTDDRRLSVVATEWATEADRIFGEVLERERHKTDQGTEKRRGTPPTGITPPMPVPPGKEGSSQSPRVPTQGLLPLQPETPAITRSRKDVTAAALRESVLAILTEALQGVTAERFDVELTLKPRGGGA